MSAQQESFVFFFLTQVQPAGMSNSNLAERNFKFLKCVCIFDWWERCHPECSVFKIPCNKLLIKRNENNVVVQRPHANYILSQNTHITHAATTGYIQVIRQNIHIYFRFFRQLHYFQFHFFFSFSSFLAHFIYGCSGTFIYPADYLAFMLI